ncbi:hypothetical protein ACTPEM_22920, partial [Clostridioides difficile]
PKGVGALYIRKGVRLHNFVHGGAQEKSKRAGTENIPAIVGYGLRTTIIVGFPGETEDDFKQLVDFVEEVKFDRLGAFAYSREED